MSTTLHLHKPEAESNLSEVYKRVFNCAVELFVVTAYLTEWDDSLTLSQSCRHFRMIVGRDFGITRKDACRKVISWLPSKRKAEFLVADRIVGFHPKAAFWREQDGKCYAIVGSSNLTIAAFESNYEANVVLLLSEDDYVKAKNWIKQIEDKSVVVSEHWLEKYREAAFSTQVGKSTKASDRAIPVIALALPRPRGMEKVLAERRQALAVYQKRRSGLENLFQRCAKNEISSDQFFVELPQHWSSAIGDRLQGIGWERRGKNSNFQELSKSFLAILAASSEDRDDMVQHEIDRLEDREVETRGSFFSEMLCLRFPRSYPVLNDPVWQFIAGVSLATPRGASSGAKYIFLAKTLRASLLDDQSHPAKNLAELDTVIWLKYRRKA
jgi:hypothetical protein